MRTYMIILEREDKLRVEKFIRFECLEKDFNSAVLRAEQKIRDLKKQIDISYEIISIDRI